jgi:hypothetical protein
MMGSVVPDLIEAHLRFGLGHAPSAPLHPKFVDFVAHYQSLAPATGVLPGRQHFDPLRIPKLLPHLWLLDVVTDDPRCYRVRLSGSALAAAGGKLRRGVFFSDAMTPSAAAYGMRVFDEVREGRHVDWRRGRAMLSHLKHIAYLERAVCPMASDGVNVDLLFCMTLFYWTDGRVY